MIHYLIHNDATSAKAHCLEFKDRFPIKITRNLELAKKIGLKPSRRIEFYTSKIDCRLFEYELYAGTREPEKI